MYLPVRAVCECCEDAIRGFRERRADILEYEVVLVWLVVPGVIWLLVRTIKDLDFPYTVI